MKTRIIWVMVSTLLIIGLLAGAVACAGGQATPTPSSQPSPSAKPSATASAAPTTSSPSPSAKPSAAPTTSAPPAQVYTMKVSSYGGETYIGRLVMEKMMKLVEEGAKGRVKFEYFAGDSLYGIKDAGEAVTKGVIQIANAAMSYYTDKIGARGEAYLAPFTWDLVKFQQNYRKNFLTWEQVMAGPKLNWMILQHELHSGFELFSRVPIRTPDDVKGKLIRATGASSRPIELIGGKPVVLSGSDIYDALQKGTLDSALSSMSVAISSKYYDVGPYVTIWGFTPSSMSAVMNLEYYNKLPADLQKLFVDSATEAEKIVIPYIQDGIGKDIEFLKKQPKVEVTIMNAAQLKQLADMVKPYHDEKIKQFGPEWTEFLNIVKQDNMGI